jgi:signal transduction histidine kinase
VLSSFADRVGEAYSSEDVLPRMATVLGEGTKAEAATVWIALAGFLRPASTWPIASTPAPLGLDGDSLPTIEGQDAVEVRHQGELLGALSVRMPANDPMNPSKDKLVRDLASQAGLVLRNVRLIEELRASRQRLVAAQDEERRKLERNLHDGAQQQLVALSVQLKLARTLVERDPAKAGAMLETLQGSAGQAIDDLRDLARGIYPPLLADKGLVVALEAQARRSPVPVTVESEGVGRYPQDLEAAVYFSCLEALNNVAKYADASAATISLVHHDGVLGLSVADDGLGFDPSSTGYGTGLQGMADRLDAIGGRIEVESTPGHGTTIRATVPASTRPEAPA